MSGSNWQLALADCFREPLLFDELIEVARNTCAGGASIASAVISCAAYLESPLTGLPALRACMLRSASLHPEAPDWLETLAQPLAMDRNSDAYAPGFGHVDERQAARVVELGRQLVASCLEHRGWLLCRVLSSPTARDRLGPLNLTGLAALLLQAHGCSVDEAERLYLWWRMEPALARAQRARAAGLGSVPFLTHEMRYTGARPPSKPLDFHALAREIGLE